MMIFLCVVLVATSCGKKTGSIGPDSTSEIELRLNLHKGKVYDMKMVYSSQTETYMMGQKMDNSNSNTEIRMDYEVKDVLVNGNFLVRTTYKTLKMTTDVMDMKFSFDSETGSSSGMQGKEIDVMKERIGQYAEMEMDKLGKNIKTTMSPGLRSGDIITNVNYSVFPDKKIKIGDTWESDIKQDINGYTTNGIIKTKFKLVSVKDGVAEISMDGALDLKPGTEEEITGTQKGTAKVEIATGVNNEVIIDQDVQIESNMGIKMIIKNKIRITIK